MHVKGLHKEQDEVMGLVAKHLLGPVRYHKALGIQGRVVARPKEEDKPKKPIRKESCKPGETAANTGCTPAGDGSGKSTGKEGTSGEGNKPLWAVTRSEAESKAKIPDPKTHLEDIADALRSAMEEAVGSPKDQCIATAYALKTVYPEAEIYSGKYRGEPHTLAKLGGKFIDVTADQFEDTDSVQVLDPEDLPRQYRRFMQIHDYEVDSSKPQWETQPDIVRELHSTLASEGKRIARLEHARAVMAASKEGLPVPDDVKREFPEYFGKKYLQNNELEKVKARLDAVAELVSQPKPVHKSDPKALYDDVRKMLGGE